MNVSNSEYSNVTTVSATIASALTRSFSKNEILSAWIAFGMVWSFGFVANTIVLVAFCKMKHTPLNVIIMGLCCSDILSAVASPFVVTHLVSYTAYEEYPWNWYICKTALPAVGVTSAVTIALVLALSLWRFYAISSPHNAAGYMTLKKSKVLVISIWTTVSIVVGSLPLYYLDMMEDPRNGKSVCFIRPSEMWLADIYHFVDVVLTNFLPISVIVLLCIAIGLALLRKKLKRQEMTGNEEFRREEKQALIQLAAIMSSFLVGFAPKLIFTVLYYTSGFKTSRQHDIAFLAGRWIVNLTECMNPILYNITSPALWKSVKETFKWPFRKISMSFNLRASPETVVQQSGTQNTDREERQETHM